MRKPHSLQSVIQKKYFTLTLLLGGIIILIFLGAYGTAKAFLASYTEDLALRQITTVLNYHSEGTSEDQEQEALFLAEFLHRAAFSAHPEKPLPRNLAPFCPWEGKALAPFGGRELHLYRISSEGVVTESSLPEDLGLDLSGYPQFWRTLSALPQGKIYLQAPLPRGERGLFQRYAYLKQSDGSFLEASISTRAPRIEGAMEIIKKFPLLREIALYHYPTFVPGQSNTPPLKEAEKQRLRQLSGQNRHASGNILLRRSLFRKQFFFFWSPLKKSSPHGEYELLPERWVVLATCSSFWLNGLTMRSLGELLLILLLTGTLFVFQGKRMGLAVSAPIQRLLKEMNRLTPRALPSGQQVFQEAPPKFAFQELERMSRGFRQLSSRVSRTYQAREQALERKTRLSQRLQGAVETVMDLADAVASGENNLSSRGLRHGMNTVPGMDSGAFFTLEGDRLVLQALTLPRGSSSAGELSFPHPRDHRRDSSVLRETSYFATLSSSASQEPSLQDRLAEIFPGSGEVLVKPFFLGSQYAGELVLAHAEGSFSPGALRAADALGNALTAFTGLQKLLHSQDTFQKEILGVMTGVLELHDAYTEGHSQGVARLAKELALELSLPEKEAQQVCWAGLVHDIGKVLIPREILNKPSALSEEEFGVIKTHPALGYAMLKKNERLESIALPVLHHHERWDGFGYPEGLKGDNIPSHARILSLADSWDAMTSSRSYRKALSFAQAREEILRNSGSQFDPEMVRAFVPLLDRQFSLSRK